jgi:hypothetical protein
MSNREAMPSLNKNEIESRPRSREKGSTRSRENTHGDMQFYLSCDFPERTEGRAPEPLHVGRRPIALAQPEVGDPGSKGERVAWKTAPSSRRVRHTKRDLSPLRRSPLDGRWMEGEPSPRRSWP